MKKIPYVITAIALCLLLTPLFIFVVDERESAVVLRFGKPIHVYTEPGLHFKTPFADAVNASTSISSFGVIPMTNCYLTSRHGTTRRRADPVGHLASQ